jgi:hypothetical protein
VDPARILHIWAIPALKDGDTIGTQATEIRRQGQIAKARGPNVTQSQEPPSDRSEAGLSQHSMWIAAAAIAALIVVVIGFGFTLHNDNHVAAQNSSVATFVGSEILRRLPPDRSEIVGRLAAQGRDAARNRQNGARQFQRRKP